MHAHHFPLFCCSSAQASTRAYIGQALQEAAAEVQAQDALPPEGRDIGEYILGPKNGEWVRWEDAWREVVRQQCGQSMVQPAVLGPAVK